jgi:hypothetical protein
MMTIRRQFIITSNLGLVESFARNKTTHYKQIFRMDYEEEDG